MGGLFATAGKLQMCDGRTGKVIRMPLGLSRGIKMLAVDRRLVKGVDNMFISHI